MLFIVALIFVIFLIVGTPISFVIGISSMTASFVNHGISPTALTTKLITGIDTFPLMAGAFFILAGEVMSTGSITSRLVDFSKVIIGRVRGGSALTTVAASVFFAGISGAAVADLAAVGSILTPGMKHEGYDEDFATALPVAASIVGPIIPPSTIMVIYAMATSGSVGALFMAGIIPGLIMGGAIGILAYYYSVKRKYPRNDEPFPGIRQFLVLFRKAILVLVMPLIIVGGVLSGVFTATESGNIAAVYALFLSVFIYREYSLKNLYKVLVNSSVTISIALLVISTATSLSWIFAVEQIPQKALVFMTNFTNSPIVFLLLLNILLFIAGMFLDPGAAIILLAPVLVPLGHYFMLDPLHLAIVVVLNLTVGLITPPVGVCLYVGSGIGKISLERVVRQVVPFVVIDMIVVLLITYLPEISLTLPKALGF